jgi:predicted ATPase
LERSARTLAWSRELGHTHTHAFALIFAAFLHYHRREGRQVQEYAEALLALATEHGFAVPEFWSRVFQGWALTTQGYLEEGLSLLRQLTLPQGSMLGQLLFVLGADASRTAGEAEEGRQFLEKEALAAENLRGFWMAETYRLKGELTLQQENQKPVLSVVEGAKGKGQKSKIKTEAQGEAEACFLKAINIAQKQQAKSFELRATMSLARLWQSQGKQHAARNRLADVYNWFTEGFDTKDLQEAKALLEELGQ